MSSGMFIPACVQSERVVGSVYDHSEPPAWTAPPVPDSQGQYLTGAEVLSGTPVNCSGTVQVLFRRLHQELVRVALCLGA